MLIAHMWYFTNSILSIGNNFNLEGAVKLIFVPTCLSWDVLSTY